MKGPYYRLDDSYEHIFAMLNAMEKKTDAFVLPPLSEAVIHLPSVFCIPLTRNP